MASINNDIIANRIDAKELYIDGLKIELAKGDLNFYSFDSITFNNLINNQLLPFSISFSSDSQNIKIVNGNIIVYDQKKRVLYLKINSIQFSTHLGFINLGVYENNVLIKTLLFQGVGTLNPTYFSKETRIKVKNNTSSAVYSVKIISLASVLNLQITMNFV